MKGAKAMRKLKRSMAKANMRELGMKRLNKKRWTMTPAGDRMIAARMPSIFAENWRKYVYGTPLKRNRRRAG